MKKFTYTIFIPCSMSYDIEADTPDEALKEVQQIAKDGIQQGEIIFEAFDLTKQSADIMEIWDNEKDELIFNE